MRYEILGELRVVCAEGVIAPRARKIEALLAILLARANQVVSTDQLVVELWGESPPARANAALYVYVSQLRKLLHGDGDENSPIVTRTRGYSLRVEPGRLDVEQFQALYAEGRRLYRAKQYAPAVEVLDAAVRLWRGPVFGGQVDSPVVGAYSTLLEEGRLECLELQMEAELSIGRHREVIGRLSALTTEYALRETFYQYLMVALHRSGRRAEALETYRTAHRRLNEEVGIGPCRPLQELHQKILTDNAFVAA
ncbi:BTAD domain-containing putative transcriptional regulator [Saccharothrix sp. HUAS TT1]|uniref:AfsR/SARP family transcriptional regulator n=1 Tax=unclassified Saccharothrix TaxID=2593673 RepID=UPI00345C5F3C